MVTDKTHHSTMTASSLKHEDCIFCPQSYLKANNSINYSEATNIQKLECFSSVLNRPQAGTAASTALLSATLD